MLDKHPYTSGTSHVVQAISYFRRSFPSIITIGTIKKLGFAPGNESRVINILRFLGLIDDEGNKTDVSSRVFSLQDDLEFSKELGGLVSKAYSDLFELHGESTWGLNSNALISFFRSSDTTSENVGKLQASTFQTLAALSGHGEIPSSKAPSQKTRLSGSPKSIKTNPSPPPAKGKASENNSRNLDLGLTVRIEINLPSDGNQETYDLIFKSIRENLINV